MEGRLEEGMAATSQAIFGIPERSAGFILLGPVDPWKALSQKPQDLIFNSSPDLNTETESSFLFILPLGLVGLWESLSSDQPCGFTQGMAQPF